MVSTSLLSKAGCNFQQQVPLLLLMDGQQRSAALTVIASAVLACNSGLAIYNSWGDAASVAFVLVADAALLLLFLCLRVLERAARGGAAGGGRSRSRIKGAVWALSTLLTAMFASRVAPLVGAAVWLMAVATAAGGFWALFLN
ncbi:hypothetical protein SETIT_4G034900v2 [Setaria italica]|uniref:Uncharacterized protein n=2 Tax=Setaria italica TaxID=4555 RepID=A0A368QQJ3_SETIT|nr:uncharacterized protein LOC105913542 [Setaria italica]RCV20172.1 hypothetical protein SETIT_4G034900v2 [Setaria italica]